MEKSQMQLHAKLWRKVTLTLSESHGDASAKAAAAFTECVFKISDLLARLQKSPKAYEEWLTLKRDSPVSQAHVKKLERQSSFEALAAIEEAALRPFVRAARCDKFKSPLVQKVADAVSDCYDAICYLQEALDEKKKIVAMEEKFQKGLRKSNPELSKKKTVKKGAK